MPMILVLVKDRFRKILESTVAAKGVGVCTVPEDVQISKRRLGCG